MTTTTKLASQGEGSLMDFPDCRHPRIFARTRSTYRPFFKRFFFTCCVVRRRAGEVAPPPVPINQRHACIAARDLDNFCSLTVSKISWSFCAWGEHCERPLLSLSPYNNPFLILPSHSSASLTIDSNLRFANISSNSGSFKHTNFF